MSLAFLRSQSDDSRFVDAVSDPAVAVAVAVAAPPPTEAVRLPDEELVSVAADVNVRGEDNDDDDDDDDDERILGEVCCCCSSSRPSLMIRSKIRCSCCCANNAT